MRPADAFLLATLVAATLAWPLAAPPIAFHGEAREGLVVQDVVRHGRWVLPLRNGELPSKPPLYHWIAAAAAHVAGLSDAIVRLPSALGALVIVLATAALGMAAGCGRAGAAAGGAGGLAGGRAVGWLAAGVLLGTHDFVQLASRARVDMVFSAAVTVGLIAFFRWYRTGDRGARAACYAAAACSVLAKGPVGVILLGLVIGAFLARERRLDRWRALWSWPLAAAVVVVDVGWYAAAAAAGGAAFLELQLLQENVQRFAGRGVFGLHGGRGRLMLAGDMMLDLLPWTLVLPWAAVRWWRGEREDTAGRFLHTWWLVILAFFTLAYGKRSAYLLPLCPALALLAARALAGALAARPGAPGLPVPAARLAWLRPARVQVAVAVALVAGGMTLGIQLARYRDVRRESLLSLVPAVRRAVPPEAVLEAAPTLAVSDRQVLAYRLARAIPWATDAATAEPRYRLLPAEGLRPAERMRLVAVSDRRGPDVALVRILPPARDLATAPGARLVR